jgi:peptide/nickel transport system substrate-binding protein
MHHPFRRSWIAIIAMVSVAVAAGCGGSSGGGSSAASGTSTSTGKVGGTLNLLAQSNPDSIDPAIAYQVESWDYLHITYDGLVAFKEVGGAHSTDLVPDLATSLPTPTDGGKTYTFTLRKGILRSDGTPVKASDFLASIERLWKATSPSPYFRDIVGAAACDAKPATCDLSKGIVVNDAAGTIAIHLTQPDGELLDQLALPFAYILPPGLPDKDVGTAPVPSTGPYMIKSFSPSTGITLVRNPHFKVWSKDAQPAGNPDTISYKWGVSNESEASQVENGQADWFFDNPPADRLSEISTKFPNQIHLEPSLGTYWYFLNTRIPPFNNLKARQAVNFAINRNSPVKLWGGPAVATPTCQLIPPAMPGGSPTYCPYTSGSDTTKYSGPDMAKAKSLVAASGTKGDKVAVYTETVEPVKSIGEYIQSVMNQLGYKTTLKALAHGPYFTTVADSRNNVNTGWYDWFPDYPVASNFINVLFSCTSLRLNSTANNNAALWCDKGVQSKITAALAAEATGGANSTSAQWNAIDKTVTDQAPLIPLFNSKNIYFVSSRVGNFQYSIQWTTLLDQLTVQ